MTRAWNEPCLYSLGASARAGERKAQVNCTCGFQDFAALPKLPPGPGLMWSAGRCPRCAGGIMFEHDRSEGGKAPIDAPDQSLYAGGRNYNPHEILRCR